MSDFRFLTYQLLIITSFNLLNMIRANPLDTDLQNSHDLLSTINILDQDYPPLINYPGLDLNLSSIFDQIDHNGIIFAKSWGETQSLCPPYCGVLFARAVSPEFVELTYDLQNADGESILDLAKTERDLDIYLHLAEIANPANESQLIPAFDQDYWVHWATFYYNSFLLNFEINCFEYFPKQLNIIENELPYHFGYHGLRPSTKYYFNVEVNFHKNITVSAKTFSLPANITLLKVEPQLLELEIYYFSVPEEETPLHYYFRFDTNESRLIYKSEECVANNIFNAKNVFPFEENRTNLRYDELWISPNTRYYAELVVQYGLDILYVLDHYELTTPMDYPGAPRDMELDELARDLVTLRWSPPAYFGGAVDPLVYVISYVMTPENMTGIVETEDHSWKIPPNLTCSDCSLELEVRARNELGEGKSAQLKLPPVKDSKFGLRLGLGLGGAILLSILLFLAAFIFAIRRRKFDKVLPRKPLVLPKELESLKKIDLGDLVFKSKLGDGCFGVVHEAIASNLHGPNSKRVVVACKTAKDSADDQAREALVEEAIAMRNLDHGNVVKILGYFSTEDHRFGIIMELVPGGSLLTFLRRCRPTDAVQSSSVSLCDLLRITEGLLNGCRFVEEMGLVHRDLAARNCLVTSNDPSSCTIKLSDFGLSKELYKVQYYRLKAQSTFSPRWTAPDIMRDHSEDSSAKFTSKSDVWSFGVTCWEIFTLGKVPYGDVDNSHAETAIIAGKVLDRPRHCPNDIFEIIRTGCFKYDQDHRQSFAELKQLLDPVIEGYRALPHFTNSSYINIDENLENQSIAFDFTRPGFARFANVDSDTTPSGDFSNTDSSINSVNIPTHLILPPAENKPKLNVGYSEVVFCEV